ncbi:MAG: hypothetical protein WDN00_15010 [Limisphaerales bacterium]
MFPHHARPPMKAILRETSRRRICQWGVRVLALLSLTLSAQPVGEELTTAAAVRGLSVEQAQQQRRVHLRGVVTFFDENLYSRFLQDDTGRHLPAILHQHAAACPRSDH